VLNANIAVNFLEYTALSKLFANFSAGVSVGATVWFCALAVFKSMAALFALPPKNDGLIKLKFKFSAWQLQNTNPNIICMNTFFMEKTFVYKH
jgi:hypothetical protein